MEFQLHPSPIVRTSKRIFSGGVENEWTPVVTFVTPGDLSSFSYTVQSAYYYRAGSHITAFFQISTGTDFTHSTASGNLKITGLGFTPRRTNSGLLAYAMGGLRWHGITKAGYTNIVPQMQANSTDIFFVASGSGVTSGNVVAADVVSGAQVLLHGGVAFQSEDLS